MKKYFLLILVLFFSCKQEKNSTEIIKTDETTVENLILKVYDYNGLEPLLNINDDKIYVVNFWATWCAPCVKELPYF